MNKPIVFETFPHVSELPLQMQHEEEDVERAGTINPDSDISGYAALY